MGRPPPFGKQGGGLPEGSGLDRLRALALRTPSRMGFPSCGRTGSMPRQRVDHSRIVYVVPPDLPERLKRFQEESDLPWAEIARRLGTYPHTVKRWWKEGVRPHFRHQMALLDLADDLGLGHLFTDWSIRRETGNGTPGSAGDERSSARVLRPTAPPRCKSPKRKAAHRRGARDRRG